MASIPRSCPESLGCIWAHVRTVRNRQWTNQWVSRQTALPWGSWSVFHQHSLSRKKLKGSKRSPGLTWEQKGTVIKGWHQKCEAKRSGIAVTSERFLKMQPEKPPPAGVVLSWWLPPATVSTTCDVPLFAELHVWLEACLLVSASGLKHEPSSAVHQTVCSTKCARFRPRSSPPTPNFPDFFENPSLVPGSNMKYDDDDQYEIWRKMIASFSNWKLYLIVTLNGLYCFYNFGLNHDWRQVNFNSGICIRHPGKYICIKDRCVNKLFIKMIP